MFFDILTFDCSPSQLLDSLTIFLKKNHKIMSCFFLIKQKLLQHVQRFEICCDVTVNFEPLYIGH